jgi:tetratricopeptide (TPR) repeat protein
MIWLLALQLATSPQIYYDEAKSALAQKNLTEADREVNAALHLDPHYVPALVLKARIALFAHRPDVAKSCLITAVTMEPQSEEAQFYLGIFYYLQNDFTLAIAPLKEAQALDPKRPMPPFYLALTEEAMGNTSESLSFYQQAEALSPEKTEQWASIQVAYARLLYTLGRYKESVEKLQLAVAADDGARDAHYELAKGLSQEGQNEKAAAEGERALALPAFGTSDAQIHFLLGNIYLKLGKPELAQEHMAKFRAAPQTTSR